MKNKGFTIIEIIILLSIIGILVAIAYPYFVSYKNGTNISVESQIPGLIRR